MNKSPQYMQVWATFTQESKLPNKLLDIPRRGSVGQLVDKQLSPAERAAYVGTLNTAKTTWLD